MFKFIKFTKVKTKDTVLEFRGGDDVVKVNHFNSADVVSVEADVESDIDALVAQQSDEINCAEIEQDEFKTLVENSAQLQRIRQIVKEKIALRYDSSDELSLIKKAADDVKRVAYEDYVFECLNIGYALKSDIGYKRVT